MIDMLHLIISSCTPTLMASDEAKERFYEDLTRVADLVPSNH